MILKDTNLIFSTTSGDAPRYNRHFLEKIKKEKKLYASKDDIEMLGLSVDKGGSSYIVIASGNDKYGNRKMTFLKWVMITTYLIIILIGWASIYFFVNRVISPLETLKKNVAGIDYQNLNFRLKEKGQGEEIDTLSVTFNQMLSRLEKVFNYQKDFVHYASHEFRTPLAAMISLTENSLRKNLSQEELSATFNNLLDQQKNLTEITNSLLILSTPAINFDNGYPLIRIDEVLFRAIDITKFTFPKATLHMNLMDAAIDEQDLLIRGNEALLIMAFTNLAKNAIQYSADMSVSIQLLLDEERLVLKFLNKGNALPGEEKEKIFTPFYRSSNAATVSGHGLGLALVKQILQLHKAEIAYSYNEGYNVFSIIFNPTRRLSGDEI
jgi:signal transduction histidine kinase